jgi:hypothetical protein
MKRLTTFLSKWARERPVEERHGSLRVTSVEHLGRLVQQCDFYIGGVLAR